MKKKKIQPRIKRCGEQESTAPLQIFSQGNLFNSFFHLVDNKNPQNVLNLNELHKRR